MRIRDERGATLVEASLTVPLFLVMIFAILEFGLAFRDYLTVANTTRFSARSAAAVGDNADADYTIIRKVVQSSAAIGWDQIDYVVVYEASNPDDSLSSATAGAKVTCRDGTSVTNVCNVYRPADFARQQADFGCQPTNPDRFWCPTDRKVALQGPNGPPDYIGIYVKANHDFVTGFFGQTLTLTDETIMQVEPQVVE